MDSQLTSLKVTQLLREDIINFLGEKNIKQFYKKNVSYTFLTLFKVWIAIGGLFLIGNNILINTSDFSFFYLLIISFLMATRINALNVQVHEGSHYLLAKNKYLNDLICNFSFAYPIGIDVQTYRSVHLPHHQYLNEDKDPDLELYTYEKKQLFGSIIKDFLGITAINRLKIYSNISRTKKKDKNKIKNLFGKSFINLILISILSLSFGLFNGLTLYISLWIFPIVSIFPIIIRMRTISEHSPSIYNFNNNVPLFISRTTKCNFIEKYILGSQMEYHFEHHIFPNIPYRSQKLMHDMLWRKGYFRDNLDLIEFNNTISSGYINSTKNLITYS